jgi:hypothetical protein
LAFAKLTIIQPGRASWELEVKEQVLSIGRALDNTVCLEGDTNVSRYHAEIDKRGQDFWITDLGSSNGTTVNDERVEIERQLFDGNLIGIGGSSLIEFHLSDTPWRSEAVEEPVAPQEMSVAPAEMSAQMPVNPNIPNVNVSPNVNVLPVQPSGGPSIPLILAGVGGGLVLTLVVAALIFKLVSSECNPGVRIVSPQTGVTLRGPLKIHVEVEGEKCIETVVYQIDGNEVAKAETSPYDVTIESSQLQNFGSGNHILSVTVEDQSGKKVVSPDTVLFAVGTAITENNNSSTTDDGQGVAEASPTVAISGTVDIGAMTDRLAGQISRKSGYSFDRDLVNAIRLRSNEYRINGYSDRALLYRREINKAFRDQGLDPLLGYILAMSRSKFNVNANSGGIGLWQMSLSLAQSQGYLGAGESDAALKDPKRSAEIAAAYTKALISTFESTDDFMYAVASFGDPLSEAGKMRTSLATQAPDPVARRDFFKMVRSGVVKGEQMDRVVRFFAAGIVGENPQMFDLRSDRPFSSLF